MCPARCDGGISRLIDLSGGIVVEGLVGWGSLFLLLLIGSGSVVGLELAHEGSGLSSELALLTNGSTVLVEEEREGNTGQGKECGDRRGPVDAKVLVHVAGEERESSTEERSENRVGSKNGGGEDSVGVDEVVHDTEEDENQ
jgi:hypothetical protein